MKFNLRIVFLVASLQLLFATANAQTVITATGYSGYYYAAAGSPPVVYAGGGITFNVINTNSTAITIVAVGYSAYLANSASLWYSASSTTGAPGMLSTPTWTQAASVTSPTVTYPTINNNFFSGLNIVIPANATYRFAVMQDGALFGGPTLSPGTFTSNGVTLDASNNYYGGDTYGGLVFTGYGYYGSITINPCPAPTGLGASGILSTTANVNWTGVTGSIGYDYFADQNPTVTGAPTTFTTTTATTGSVSGLMPATMNYLHVRNKCGSANFSQWANYGFMTQQPCNKPSNLIISNLMPPNAKLDWTGSPSATSYDYQVDQNKDDPIGSTGLLNVLTPSDNIGGLNENQWYYVHIRSNCPNEKSGWSLDSFLTPIPCRAPKINIDYVNSNRAVAYWDPVATALEYEYAITNSPTPPVQGTIYQFTSILTSALDDGVDYYVHVRTHCSSAAVESSSPWGTASFKTWPTGISNVSGDDFNMEVFPNPAGDIVQIKLSGITINDKTVITLTDLSGKTIKQLPVESNDMQADLSGIAAGVYLFKYSDGEHNRVIRLTKQ